MRGQGSARRAAAALLRGGPPTPGGGAAAVTAAHGPPNAAGERLRATSGRAESGDKLGGAGDWPAGWGGPGGGGGAGGFALSSGHSVFGGRGTAVDFYSLEFDGLLAIELERPHLLHGHGAAIHGIGSTTPSDAAVAAAAADAVTAAAVEAAAQAEAEADFYENVHEFSEEHTLVLRSAWFCSGATSLPQMREQLERRIRFLAALEEDGWELTSPVDSHWVCLANAAPKPRDQRLMPDAWEIVEEWQALSTEAEGGKGDAEEGEGL